MSQANRIYVLKKGEVGKIIEFTLSDAAGVVDLSAYTITMSLQQDDTYTVSDVAVTKRDQETNPGECYYTWDATTANIPAGVHKGNLKLVSGSNVRYWPADKLNVQSYFEVRVQEPIDAPDE